MKLEKRIHDEYQKASDEVERKLKEHLNKFDRLDKLYSDMVENGKMKKSDYIRWRKSNMIRGEAWKNLRDVLVNDMNNANKIAINMINKHVIDCYALNFNYGTYEIENGLRINTGFSLYDHSTVENLMKDKPQIIPKARLDIPRDKRWNKRKMTSAITQGILTGDSIPDIAKRLRSVSDMNEHAAIRNARTYTTAAQNKGRIDSYQRAKELGIELQKEWMSTPDGRTRDSHVDLDGERVEIDGTFSNGCRYPADPMGEPAEVYNCRCTLVAAIKGQQYHDDRFTRLPDGMTYDDWKAHKLNVDEGDESKHVVVNGKDISATWTRREDKFSFAINDVINAQGFDGKPKLVTSEEKFNEAVKAADGFIAQRTYSASDIETLRAYQEQLYRGKWYVDCSKGGANYGQGMYCVSDMGGSITENMQSEMSHYIELNNKRGNSFSFTETFTLDPSAKKITFGKACGAYARELEKEGVGDYDSLFEAIVDGDQDFDGRQLMNIGSWAAMKGYDAIDSYRRNAKCTYTVILNRTKVIFKRS